MTSRKHEKNQKKNEKNRKKEMLENEILYEIIQ